MDTQPENEPSKVPGRRAEGQGEQTLVQLPLVRRKVQPLLGASLQKQCPNGEVARLPPSPCGDTLPFKNECPLRLVGAGETKK